jgi:hypothetical protein
MLYVVNGLLDKKHQKSIYKFFVTLKLGRRKVATQFLNTAIRLLNLPLQRQRCSRLESFSKWNKIFSFENEPGYPRRCKSKS